MPEAHDVLAGAQGKWRWLAKNDPLDPNAHAGDSVVWTWDEVKHHTMRWIAAFRPGTSGMRNFFRPALKVVDDANCTEIA